MKTFKNIIVLLLSLSVLQSCNKGSIWGIYGKGSSVNRERSISAFTSINFNCDGTIIYVQDSVYSLQVSAQENIQSILETKVVDNELRVNFLREVRTHNGLTVTVHAPSVNSFLINGSGNITVQNTYTANTVALYVNGSGNITIPTLTSTVIDAKISGSGNINLNGGTNSSATYYINGAGNVNSLGMTSKVATVKISGAGGVSINATDNINVTISGSGDVRYKGTPSITSQVSGTGRLIKL